MTATTEQLLALLRDAQEFIDHTAICDEVEQNRHVFSGSWGGQP